MRHFDDNHAMISGSASWLFVPGNRPDRFDKAARAGADQVIVDLEDAVAPARKASAREEVARWLGGASEAWVRVNARGTQWHQSDLGALAGCPGLRGVMVPKAEDPAGLGGVARGVRPGTPVIALVETAVGVRDAAAVAACPAVSGLAFGSIDFALDIDAAETDEALLFARSALVVAARAASLPAPLDGVTVETTDTAVIRRDAERARSLGFGGKLCIHPAQVEPVNGAFGPDPADVAWARRVLAAAAEHAGGEDAEGAFDLDGEMIDAPVLERARRLVARAGGREARRTSQ
jgi:citrate lyase subunit beta / citryl-CoA lyase